MLGLGGGREETILYVKAKYMPFGNCLHYLLPLEGKIMFAWQEKECGSGTFSLKQMFQTLLNNSVNIMPTPISTLLLYGQVLTDVDLLL